RVQREAARAVARLRIETDVVDRRLRAVVLAALDRDLELARQGQVERVEEEVLVDRDAVRRDVEGLAGRRSRERAGGHVAHAVGEADRAPLVRRELTADEALGPAGVQRQGGAMLCFGGTHQTNDYGRPLSAKSTSVRRRRRLCATTRPLAAPTCRACRSSCPPRVGSPRQGPRTRPPRCRSEAPRRAPRAAHRAPPTPGAPRPAASPPAKSAARARRGW